MRSIRSDDHAEHSPHNTAVEQTAFGGCSRPKPLDGPMIPDPALGEIPALPDPGEGFAWTRTAESILLQPFTSRAEAAFTTRIGGFCTPPFDGLNISYAQGAGKTPDWPERVKQNRRICAEAIGGSPNWTRVRQLQSVGVVEALHNPEVEPLVGVNMSNPAADACWTDDPSRTLAVSAADCFPILLTSAGKIAVVHSGWRGAYDGVVQAAAAAIEATEMFVGPGIGPCHLQLSTEIVAKFEKRFGSGTVRDDGFVDLWQVFARLAAELGIEAHVSHTCVHCHSEFFFSHRRDQGVTGRQALVARLA